jgi:cysteine desulfurase
LGTENLPGFVGLGEAARVRFADLPAAIENMSRLRDLFEAELKIRIPAIVVNGGCSSRLCNTSNIRFEGINAEALMARMNEAGLYCSLGSACRSMLPSPSYVLMAMGLSSEEAFGSLRFSFSVTTTQEEVFAALAIIEHNWQILKSLSFL